MDFIFEKIVEAIKGFLIGIINGNLTRMFTDVNEKVGTIATEVGKTPEAWNSGVFNMIHTLSDTVVVPIAGMILTYVLCYELISMLIEKNNMHDIDTFMFFKYIFKMWVAVFLVTHTFDIAMAVFDVSQHVISTAATAINGDTAIDISSTLGAMQAGLEAMTIPDLLLLVIETTLIQFAMLILSIIITVLLYGRMIEIYLYCSVAPIPFATMSNREWGSMGNNYLKALCALGFQGFFIMVVVGIYAVLVQSITVTDNIHSSILLIAAYTAVLGFTLIKTGSISKAIFNAH